ncbi:MAG: rRNA maturation RNase YbeY [Bacteroidetes bacterium]|uniref:Endoribonuclease YbeY n=1 Tax=Candidatus Enterocola intestinipullorum TaxID=2840783 RepID=A0A9D9EGW4_9BACT|nr:rRNA maturation RNase YbeY [Candidatus Enterocola intestinipullorum]
MISYFTENCGKPAICTKRCSAWIKDIASKHGKTIGEIAYVFCDDAKILEVNRQYLGHDYYTDIITFDYCEDDKLSGDIFISLDTVKSNSATYGTDYYDELTRVIIHGILHLCGYKDKSDDESRAMRALEDAAIAALPKPLKK